MSENQNLPASATTDQNDPYAAYGRQAARANHPFLSFKKGFWIKGKDDDVKVGTRLVFLMSEFKLGFVKWEDNKPVADRTVVFGTEKPAAREELGDLDKALWPTDDKGQPRDPWQMSNTIPVFDIARDEQMLFTTSSVAGINAVALLCKEYGAKRRQFGGKYPVVELGAGSYTHKVYGRTPIPELKIVDWADDPSDGGGDAAQGNLLSHATGSVEEVAASTAKAGATRF